MEKVVSFFESKLGQIQERAHFGHSGLQAVNVLFGLLGTGQSSHRGLFGHVAQKLSLIGSEHFSRLFFVFN
jgi:hypothetical protein